MVNSRANPKGLAGDLLLDATKKLIMNADQSSDTYLEEQSNDFFRIMLSAVQMLALQKTTGVLIGSGTTTTSRTDNFLYIPTSAGVPSGTPAGSSGKVALVYDTTNNDLYIYDGSWLKVAVA